jgi:acetyl esterase/lipase
MMSYEGHDVAAWLNRAGVAGVVVKYRVRTRHPAPLLDAQRAIRTVRARAGAWKLDPKRIGIMGFSAGGHLASTAGTHFDAGDPKATDSVEQVSCRPDFLVLVYPVISMGPKSHGGSRKNLLGADPSPELVELLSNEKQVTKETPPTFLVHAKTDRVVSVENSAMFHAALKAKGVPSEFLELPAGAHGLGCGKGPHWEAWQAACLKWMTAQGLARP